MKRLPRCTKEPQQAPQSPRLSPNDDAMRKFSSADPSGRMPLGPMTPAMQFAPEIGHGSCRRGGPPNARDVTHGRAAASIAYKGRFAIAGVPLWRALDRMRRPGL